MFCPQCGDEIEDTAKFCMECGTDLRPFQQLSGGGVNTGDVGMMKDSQMENTESQQQASIEQNPTINIQLGEIIRESVSEAMQQGTHEQQQQYERMQETSVSVTPEIAEMLKKAKFATSDEEAEEIYDQILDADIENDVAWYGKFLLHMVDFGLEEDDFRTLNKWQHEVSKRAASPPEKAKRIFKRIAEDKKQSATNVVEPDLAEKDTKSQHRFESWSNACQFFLNAVKAAPDKFDNCEHCKAAGFVQSPCECTEAGSTGLCPKCEGTGACPLCEGSKDCIECSGTGWEEKPKLFSRGLECPSCSGTGRCSRCHPILPVIAQPRSGNVISHSRDWRALTGPESGTCRLCDGDGKCRYCDQKGLNYFFCVNCFGMGQVRVSDF